MLEGVCIFYECNTVEQGSLAARKGKCVFLSICCSSDVAECNNLGSELLVLHKKWNIQTIMSFGLLLGSRLSLPRKAATAAWSSRAAWPVGLGGC